MRGIALSLATVSSLGAALLGSHVLGSARAETRRPDAVSSAAAERVWYGGTLAPIVVVGSAPEQTNARATHTCATAGS